MSDNVNVYLGEMVYAQFSFKPWYSKVTLECMTGVDVDCVYRNCDTIWGRLGCTFPSVGNSGNNRSIGEFTQLKDINHKFELPYFGGLFPTVEDAEKEFNKFLANCKENIRFSLNPIDKQVGI